MVKTDWLIVYVLRCTDYVVIRHSRHEPRVTRKEQFSIKTGILLAIPPFFGIIPTLKLNNEYRIKMGAVGVNEYMSKRVNELKHILINKYTHKHIYTTCSTSVENFLQIGPFFQNEPNLSRTECCVLQLA